ncbi:DNA mismatch repair protein MSH3 [Pyricularia oryzae 70-15]|uniref:DNA mismatch repair protein MSH3 n=2 Tax=Pyricularia oryzae TaxID=318829 RepID=MSH3_PYRO7|nr:DNA mismatch repair protein MSH3 [Pyricularia oryzae 70-15]A4R0R0.1 RecName: Full=DNA mismatch repair protein MSH3; AltName: Full=MutS protein homolog 3 [Pyricularia oryzae 70-15]EHA57344.1 DNA mismatch repair protein MSH3 [Pyricularia oryzae 70-15]KAI7924135.1 DNA mismatch repair protein MSH3 [Pyricularia oryzae]
MAGPSGAAPKKQASLLGFFTPKTVNGLKRPTSSRPGTSEEDEERTADSSPSSRDNVRKRPLEQDPDAGNTRRPRASKRAKNVVIDDEDDEHDNDDDDDDFKLDAEAEADPEPVVAADDTAGVSQSSSISASRAGRYIYDESQPKGQAKTDENGDALDAATLRKKRELHDKFVKKLGHPDAMSRWGNAGRGEQETGAQEEEEDGDAAEEEPPPPPKGKKKGAKSGKLTPMELQFLEIKRKHMDTVLIVEVGYKFRFFGEDARIAGKELSIVCIPGKFRYDEHPSEAHLDRFASASIPVHRLPVHAKRLVAAGHKVGVVRQIETAALKKAGDNRNAPFVRKLCEVYTKGTYIDEMGEMDAQTGASGAHSGGYLLCLTETAAKGSGTDEKVDVGLVAVQPATGDIIYDSFEDGFMRSEIETRLLHISPCELLIVGQLSKATEKLVKHLSGSASNVFGDRTRVERVAKGKTTPAEASSHVTKFYAGKLKGSTQDDRAAALLDKVLNLPEPVTLCLSAMITHLTEFGLEHIFDLTKYFQSFSTRSHMCINGTTLESLEVYRNSTDHTEKGSLLWALDKTRTRFGQRMLRKWLGRPLLDKERLDDRVAAVEELFENRNGPQVEKLQKLLSSIKTDLERSLIRIFYGRCTRPELLAVLQTLQRIAVEYIVVKEPSQTGFKSNLVSEALASLPRIREIVVSYLNRINPDAARKNDKYEFFRDESDDTGDDGEDEITTQKMSIAAVEQELDAHRSDAAATLGRKKAVDYVTVAGIEYLIEVPNTEIRKVPASWAKISGTKKLSRFHTPEVVRLIAERDQHKEALAAACDAAFKAMLASIADQYQPLRDAVSSLATLDCLLSFAQVAALPGYSKPIILPDSHPPTIAVAGGRHPIAEHTLPSGYIPFSTTLSSPAPLAHLVTGPNMGGKSSFVRALALLVLLAQVGSFVPADSLRLTLSDAIYTRMGASDNLFAGESTFMVEVGETAAILRTATPRSLVLLDELGRGTSTHDGAAIAHAVLDHVVRNTRCLTLFITHYQSLARVAEGLGTGLVRNVHMRFTSSRDDNDDGDKDQDDDVGENITFLYEVADGVAHRSYGLNVARLARIPRKILEVAARKSRKMEEDVRTRRLRSATKLLEAVCRGDGSDDQLEHLLSSIEQL